jgi:hypothetical protein
MKAAVPILRSLVLAEALLLLGHGNARAQDDIDMTYATFGHTTVAKTPPPVISGQPEKSDLPPEAQRLIQDLVEKAKTQKSAGWDAEMKKQVDDIATTTGLSDAGRQTLATAANQAVAASAEEWGKNLTDIVSKQFAMIPKDRRMAMLRFAAQHRTHRMSMAESDPQAGPILAPKDQGVWTTALKQVLTPAQFDTWAQAQASQKTDTEKAINAFIKNATAETRAQETKEMMSECKGLESTLNLPKDRSIQLEALGKSAVDQSIEAWCKDEENCLLAMNESQRHSLVTSGGTMGVNSDELPMKQAVWKDGLARLLTADERTHLQAEVDARKTKRQRVMGLVMVMLLDEKLALTQAQRQKLEPIACRLVKDIPQLYPEGSVNFYNSSKVFYSTTPNASPAELKPILDPIQLKRWQDLPNADYPMSSTDDETATPGGTEPEDVERIISSFLYDQTENERKRALDQNMLKAEDITRVAQLKPEAAERLQTAACGVTEQYLVSWKWFKEQQLRSQLQDITPQNVRQRLADMRGFFVQRGASFSNEQDLWDETVQTELTPQQKDALKKETEARDDYDTNAVAQLSLAELDRQVHLDDEQWTKLLPLVTAVLKDYNSGFTQFFSGMSMSGTPWYLMGTYTAIPLAGIEDNDPKSILTTDQMDKWRSSQDFVNSRNLWQVVKQMHSQRIQRNGQVLNND